MSYGWKKYAKNVLNERRRDNKLVKIPWKYVKQFKVYGMKKECLTIVFFNSSFSYDIKYLLFIIIIIDYHYFRHNLIKQMRHILSEKFWVELRKFDQNEQKIFVGN